MMFAHNKERGFSLPIVLVMMLVLAVMVLAATQTFNTESRISSNDADRKMAMQVAEAALREGESNVATLKSSDFPTAGQCNNNGLCKPGDAAPFWESGCRAGSNCLDEQGVRYDLTTRNSANKVAVSKDPKYLIELIGKEGDEDILRVTARAWGENKNTVVTVQSYVGTTLD